MPGDLLPRDLRSRLRRLTGASPFAPAAGGTVGAMAYANRASWWWHPAGTPTRLRNANPAKSWSARRSSERSPGRVKGYARTGQ